MFFNSPRAIYWRPCSAGGGSGARPALAVFTTAPRMKLVKVSGVPPDSVSGYSVLTPWHRKSHMELQSKANRRTAEYRISNVEGWNRYAHSFLKWTEFIYSTFDVGRSMFDVHEFHIWLDWTLAARGGAHMRLHKIQCHSHEEKYPCRVGIAHLISSNLAIFGGQCPPYRSSATLELTPSSVLVSQSWWALFFPVITLTVGVHFPVPALWSWISCLPPYWPLGSFGLRPQGVVPNLPGRSWWWGPDVGCRAASFKQVIVWNK
jgi:hypothetical protein